MVHEGSIPLTEGETVVLESLKADPGVVGFTRDHDGRLVVTLTDGREVTV